MTMVQPCLLFVICTGRVTASMQSWRATSLEGLTSAPASPTMTSHLCCRFRVTSRVCRFWHVRIWICTYGCSGEWIELICKLCWCIIINFWWFKIIVYVVLSRSKDQMNHMIWLFRSVITPTDKAMYNECDNEQLKRHNSSKWWHLKNRCCQALSKQRDHSNHDTTARHKTLK